MLAHAALAIVRDRERRVPLTQVRPRPDRRVQVRAGGGGPRPPAWLRPYDRVVVCHHGARSAYVTRFLERSGFERAYNLEGGLGAYSFVDASMPRY